eukprot:9211332-Alexandrium_andersonii.AAC.2
MLNSGVHPFAILQCKLGTLALSFGTPVEGDPALELWKQSRPCNIAMTWRAARRWLFGHASDLSRFPTASSASAATPLLTLCSRLECTPVPDVCD